MDKLTSPAKRTHCPSGHPYAGDNLRITASGERKCRACKREQDRQQPRPHLYWTWRHMLARCENPNNSHYRWYGAIGVTVCDRWRVFANFEADMGERQEGKSIDRIDPCGNYEPGNCRWATRSQQAINRRPNATRWIGVSRAQCRAERFCAQIGSGGRKFYLGTFDSEIEAALAFNEAAIRLHGQDARLNDIGVARKAAP